MFKYFEGVCYSFRGRANIFSLKEGDYILKISDTCKWCHCGVIVWESQ